MISKSTISAAINRANGELKSAWNVISSNKKSKDRGRSLIGCQSKLIEALWILDTQYYAICKEKRRLIENKGRYDVRWFSRRMARLDSYIHILRNEIGKTKAVGDGYAWIFYGNDDILVDEHLKQQRQINLPPGIGRIGERAFVEKLQGFNKHFVLYHGITSYLRIGDISFFDPNKGRIKSIGELKSEQVGKDEYRVTLGFTYGPGIETPVDISSLRSNTTNEGPSLPSTHKARLRRQLSQISAAIAQVRKAEQQTILARTGEYHFFELDEVIRESNDVGFAYRRAGNSLVLAAIRIRGVEASERAFQPPRNLNKQLDPVIEAAQSIVHPNSNDNCLSVITIGYDTDGFPRMQPGTIPLMWWPLARDNLHDLIFGRVVVMSLYNPAHFWELLRSNGFSVTADSRTRSVSATKKGQRGTLQFGNLGYFWRLAATFLMSDNTILSILNDAADEAEKQRPGARVKIELKPRMKIQ